MHGVIYLVVINFILPFKISMCCVSFSVFVVARKGYPLCMGVVDHFLMVCLVLPCVFCTHALFTLTMSKLYMVEIQYNT